MMFRLLEQTKAGIKLSELLRFFESGAVIEGTPPDPTVEVSIERLPSPTRKFE